MIMTAPPSASPAALDVQPSDLRAAVRRFIGARVRDAATADDLTQEVFVKMQKRIAQVRDPKRLMGWLIQIARNTVADFFRGARRMEPLQDEHIAGERVQPDSFEREERLLREELAAYVRTVVEGLPAMYREALVLTEYDGLTQVELAKHLGLTVSAAKSRVQRARALVRAVVDRCCHFEVDAYGAVIACTPREQRCECDVSKRHFGRLR